MQYLSGMGAGLNPDPWVQNLNQITQQNIGAQSQAGLINLYKNILAGKMPGAKANLSDKGMNLTMPSNTLGLESGGKVEGHTGAVGDMGAGVSGVPSQAGATPNTPVAQQEGGFLSKLLNPSDSQPGSGNIPPSALAGLSPQDVSAALSGALSIEQLKQKQIIDMMKLAKGEPPNPLESEFPIPHPEAGIITQRQWSSLPTEEREFSAYVHAAKKLGAPKEDLTREAFLTLKPTEREQFMRATMEDPKLMEATKELSIAGRTVIDIGGDTLKREQAKHQAGILSPNFFQKTADTLKKDGRSWRSTDAAEKLSKSKDIPFDAARDHIQQAKVRESMDKQIRQVFGKVGKVTRKSDGWYLDNKLIVRDPYVE